MNTQIEFLSELNQLELYGQTDIGNAYLEAKTKENVYVIAGPEFGEELEGHLLVIVRALDCDGTRDSLPTHCT
jgi:hypothetical protein